MKMAFKFLLLNNLWNPLSTRRTRSTSETNNNSQPPLVVEQTAAAAVESPAASKEEKSTFYQINNVQQSRSSQPPNKPQPETSEESRAIQAAKSYFAQFLDHDAVEALLSSSCVLEFSDAEMLRSVVLEDDIKLRESFPDIHFTYKSITEIAPNVVFISNLVAQGTHTWTPYAFVPYPPIPATGRAVQNDPEDVTVTIDEQTGQITRMKFVAKGPLSGPPGFYQQIGGIMI